MDKKRFESELSKLPQRVVVAFAARCARRVRPLFGSHLPGGEAIEQAIVVAEQMAAGINVTVDDAKAVAKAAAWAANDAANAGAAAKCPSTANAAAYSAVQAAYARSPGEAAGVAVSADAAVTMVSFAAESAGFDPRSDLEKTTFEDLRLLVALDLGEANTLGREIDVTPTGPLGSLWPEGEPEWFRRACATAEAMLANDDR